MTPNPLPPNASSDPLADAYVRISQQRYASLLNQEQRAQQLAKDLAAKQSQIDNLQLLLEATIHSQAAKPVTTVPQPELPKPAPAPVPAKPSVDENEPTVLQQVLSSVEQHGLSAVSSPALTSNAVPMPDAVQQTTTLFDGPVPSAQAPQSVRVNLTAAENANSVVPTPNQAHSHLSTEDYVKSPIHYREIFETCLDLLYGGKPPNASLMLTPKKVSVVGNGLEMGLSRRAACALVGIGQPTYNAYRARATKNEEPFRTFLDLMDIAEARCEVRLVASWQKHTADSWQAAQAFLAKRFSQDWGDKRVLELTATQLMEMPTDQLKSIIGEELYNALTMQAAQANTATVLEHDDMELPYSSANNVVANIEFDESITYE